jgi:hypothetical protein
MFDKPKLWKKSLYTTPSVIALCNIYEYDISKANISILRSAKKIDDEQYNYFMNMNRMERQITIGKMIKNDREITEILSKYLEASRFMFMMNNQINNMNVISIKKDAMFVTKECSNLTIDNNIHFTLRNTFQLFMKVNKLELYYGCDDDKDVLDIKGINDAKLEYHFGGYLKMLFELMRLIVKGLYKEALEYIRSFDDLYENRDLPIQFYREFNSTSGYRVINSDYCVYGADSLEYVDTSYNHNLNRQIYNVLLNYLFSTNIGG